MEFQNQIYFLTADSDEGAFSWVSYWSRRTVFLSQQEKVLSV